MLYQDCIEKLLQLKEVIVTNLLNVGVVKCIYGSEWNSECTSALAAEPSQAKSMITVLNW